MRSYRIFKTIKPITNLLMRTPLLYPEFHINILICLLIFYLHIRNTSAQKIQADFPISHITQSNNESFGTYTATLGASISGPLNSMHGITYKLSFDPDVIYADSVKVSVDSEQLGLAKNEYLEMYRTGSCFVLYSLTVKGRKKTLSLKELPINIDFTIKPETYYQLIANNCEYTVEFQAESVKAYDLEKSEIELEPFVLPIDIECDHNGETQYLLAAPNPTKERSWIYLPPDKRELVKKTTLFDTKGEQLELNANQYDDKLEINLQHLRPGHYYINIIYSNGDKDVVKIVKV